MKYDAASWHYGGDFLNDLPAEAGATHIGIFVAWCLLNGLGGELHIEEFPGHYSELVKRETTPGAWFLEACDQKFTDEDLSEEGNAFTLSYYQGEAPEYLSDYEAILGGEIENLHYVPDSWETFDLLAPVIRNRYELWRSLKSL